MKSLILASKSPRRKQLLGQLIGQETFECIPSCANEEWTSADVDTAVLQIAKTKAKEIANTHDEQWVLGADTIVVDQKEILGKPKSLEEASQTLHRLSSCWHEVKTAVVLIAPSHLKKPIQEAVITTKVHFRNLSDVEIERYVASGSPLDKAGSYGIQEVDFVDQIEGSLTNVIGLPMELVESWLKDYFTIVQSAKTIENNQG
ncbi:MAG: Maf family protein [Erysipelotrichaceae bacterium]|nr:Maf family protein [Erysipelotrichaceae bacterium]